MSAHRLCLRSFNCAVILFTCSFHSGASLQSALAATTQVFVNSEKLGTLSQIQKLTEAHSFLKAKPLIEKLKRSYPYDPQVLLAAARLDRQMGLFARALAEYKQLSAQAPDMTEALVALSEMYLEYLDARQALTLARKATVAAPHDKSARLALCSALVATGNLKEAEGEVLKLLQSQPYDPDVHYVVYKLRKERGNLKQARRHLESALALKPSQIRWLMDLSELCKLQGDFTQSRRCLDQVLSIDSASVEAMEKLAIILEFYCHDYDAAMKEYRDILAIDRDSVTAQAGIDRCRTERNDVAGMLKFQIRQSASKLWWAIFPEPALD